MALSLYELVVLVIQCIIVEAQDLWKERENYRASWQRRHKVFQLLPLELVAEVVENVSCEKIDQRESTVYRQRTLYSCSRVSSLLARCAQNELLRQPYLTHGLKRFERTLRERPELVNKIEHITFDLRDETLPSVEADAATRIIPLLEHSRIRSIGLMEVREVGLRQLASVPQLERLHLHLMNYAAQFNQFSLVPDQLNFGPFYNLTSLSLSAIHLPYPTGDSSPVSELYSAEMLPNLTALELDECCTRIASKVNTFHFLRYLAIRCSCTRCIPELHLNETLFDPLELFEINPHPFFLEYFRNYSHRLPKCKRLRLTAELPRFRSARTAVWIMQIISNCLRGDPETSPLRHLVAISLPDYWGKDVSEEVLLGRAELFDVAKRRGIEVDFSVENEGTRPNRATKAACFASDFWLTVDKLKALERKDLAENGAR
ncbi:hypothetical protein JCM11491_005003 [Sporobolomyces phaffii]